MNTRILLFIALICFSCSSIAHSKVITAEEFEQLRQQIRQSYARSPAEGLNFVNTLLERTDFTLEQKIKTTNYKAWFLLEVDELEKAMQVIVEYKSMVSHSKEKSLIYGYYNISGGIFERLGLYEEALTHFREAMTYAKLRDERLVYQTESNIAHVYLKLNRFAEALSTFEHYKLFAQTNKQFLNESFASMHMVTALIGLKEYDQALATLTETMALQEKYKFTTHLTKSLVLKGKIQLLTGQLDASEKTINHVLELFADKEVDNDYYDAILCLVKTYDAQNRTEKAIALLKTLNLNTTDKFTDFKPQRDVAQLSAQLFEKINDFENALVAQKQYADINASILTKQASVNLAKALAEADLAAKEIRIAQLTKAEQIKATKAKAFRDLAIAVSICLVIILFGSFAAIQNIDKQKQRLAQALKRLNDTQKHVIEVEKIASLTSLVSGMAHQLNTPIGTIVTASSLIDEYLQSLTEKFKERNLTSKHFHQFITDTSSAKELVISSINRLAGIVEEFKALNVAINLDKPMTSIALQQFIHDRLAPLSLHLGKQIQYTVSGDDVTITSYPSILGDVLKTLVINSCEHGFVAQDHGKVDVVISREDQEVKLIYQDNGVGIDDAILQEIFTPFYTTNLGGQHLGLGLNVVFNAIKYNLKGQICAESSKHGARFVITLPIDAHLSANAAF